MKVVLSVIFVAVPAFAQAPRTDNRLQSAIDSVVHKQAISYFAHAGSIGLSLGLIVDGRTHVYNYGELTKGERNLPTAESRYCFGSVSKTFVGIMLARAVLENRINLQADIRDYLPRGSALATLSNRGRPVRVIDLATHTSRIPNQIIAFPSNWDSMSADEKYAFKLTVDDERFLDALRVVTVDTLLGRKYLYSGAAVRLLAIILERVYHRPYADLFREHFTVGMDLRKTTVVSRRNDWDGFAFGDQDSTELIRTKSGFDDLTSAPGGVSTVNDMLKYLGANLSNNDPAIVLSHRQTWEGDGRRLGLIWRLETDDRGCARVFHSGRGLRNQCLLVFYPGRKTGLVLCTNDVLPDSFLDDFSAGLFRALEF